jgi:hypothetical protein
MIDNYQCLIVKIIRVHEETEKMIIVAVFYIHFIISFLIMKFHDFQLIFFIYHLLILKTEFVKPINKKKKQRNLQYLLFIEDLRGKMNDKTISLGLDFFRGEIRFFLFIFFLGKHPSVVLSWDELVALDLNLLNRSIFHSEYHKNLILVCSTWVIEFSTSWFSTRFVSSSQECYD